MIRKTGLFLILFLGSSNLLAADKLYQADVEGMVCAFCAYSVGRDVAKLPGIDADSVDVDLKNGEVTFNSSLPVAEDKLQALFANTGFTLSNLREASPDKSNQTRIDYQLALELNLNKEALDRLESVIESVGELAAKQTSKIVLTAPPGFEEILLKPILMGRQQVMKVKFVPLTEGTAAATIKLQLYLSNDLNNDLGNDS